MNIFIKLVLLFNLGVSLFIAVIHVNKTLWTKWENGTIKYPKSHYLIGALNFFLVSLDAVLLYYFFTLQQLFFIK